MELNKQTPNILQALLPIIVLLALIVINILFVYGDAALEGPNQVALMVGTVVVCFVGIRLKYKWKELLNGMTKSIGSALPAMIILIIIGALAGTWLVSGVVPTMIYYGLKIIHPSIFLFAACVPYRIFVVKILVANANSCPSFKVHRRFRARAL